MSERSGIEIDYCPSCRGVWLDRGELDKILERSAAQAAPAAPAPAATSYDRGPQQGQGHQQGHQQGYQQGYQQPSQQQGYYKKKKKESWLSEIFD